MNAATETILQVLMRLREVQGRLGIAPTADDAEVLLADLLDSMGLVELLAVLASDRGVRPEDIEKAAGQHFTTVASLAAALDRSTSARTQPEQTVPAPEYRVSSTSTRY